MLFAVDVQGDVPVYRQLMEQVKFLIASGQLEPGDELPSTRTLSTELGVNPMTISKAYSYLEKDGILERRRGLPLIVKAVDDGQLQVRKVDLLRENLAPIVGMARQLDLDKEAVLNILSDMIDDAQHEEGWQ